MKRLTGLTACFLFATAPAMADEKRRAPTDDLLSYLVQAEEDGSVLTEDELTDISPEARAAVLERFRSAVLQLRRFMGI